MTTTFDPVQYKTSTLAQWEQAAEAWDRWDPTLRDWLGGATERMLDVTAGARVLDVAAGSGGQSLDAARRVGPDGHVLATDISPTILSYAASAAAQAGLSNLAVQAQDGERLDVALGAFDAVICRLGLIYFPDQQAALRGMYRALRPGGRLAAMVYSTADRNGFFAVPVSIIRRRAQLPAPLPGQPGPFSLGAAGVLEQALTTAGFSDVTRRCRLRCGWGVWRTACASSGNPSVPCTRCSAGCPRSTRPTSGPRSPASCAGSRPPAVTAPVSRARASCW